MRVPMKATKDMRYGTRMLKAGDAFEANDRSQARLLTALGRASAGQVEPAPEPAAPDDELTALRAEYQAAVGKRAYHGWDAATLREKISAAAS